MRHTIACAFVVGVLTLSPTVVFVPGCATVQGDPVGTNAARFVQTTNIVKSAYIAWASVLEADVHRVTPIVTPERRNQVKQIRIEIDTLMSQWSASVANREPFNGIDSLFSLLDALARFTTEAQ